MKISVSPGLEIHSYREYVILVEPSSARVWLWPCTSNDVRSYIRDLVTNNELSTYLIEFFLRISPYLSPPLFRVQSTMVDDDFDQICRGRHDSSSTTRYLNSPSSLSLSLYLSFCLSLSLYLSLSLSLIESIASPLQCYSYDLFFYISNSNTFHIAYCLD